MTDQTETPQQAPETPTGETPKTSPDPGASIPYDRFASVVRDRDELRSQIETLTAERSAFEQRAGALEIDLALTEKGFTDRDEARVAVEAYWSRLPDADRPTVAEWVRGLDPAQAPRAIAAYLSPAAPAASAQSSAPQTPAAAGLPTAAPAAPAGAPPISHAAALKAANARFSDALRSRNADAIAQARTEVERLVVARAPSTR